MRTVKHKKITSQRYELDEQTFNKTLAPDDIVSKIEKTLIDIYLDFKKRTEIFEPTKKPTPTHFVFTQRKETDPHNPDTTVISTLILETYKADCESEILETSLEDQILERFEILLHPLISYERKKSHTLSLILVDIVVNLTEKELANPELDKNYPPIRKIIEDFLDLNLDYVNDDIGIEISTDLDCTNDEMKKLCEQYLHYGYTADFYKTTKD